MPIFWFKKSLKRQYKFCTKAQTWIVFETYFGFPRKTSSYTVRTKRNKASESLSQSQRFPETTTT